MVNQMEERDFTSVDHGDRSAPTNSRAKASRKEEGTAESRRELHRAKRAKGREGGEGGEKRSAL